ncbi:putative Replication factor C subunit 3 [Blattamonas nauphoetae]|uniref:Replication factor C subunit 3 n=1 Tax=Blattamonas nauphoetae TaxID=2049346 RepID=A0ABQ9YJ30_9EUKA|nr:putative Replication factor C subunit 3 [Blattamonas nauphoetae]
MALLIDKYRPTTIEQLDYNVELAQRLKLMALEGDFPHMLFYGPSGAGKKTRVMALLRAVFGPQVNKVVVESRQLQKGTSSATFEITILSSPHHIEVCPSDAGTADRYVVMELIKEVAQSLPMHLGEAHKPTAHSRQTGQNEAKGLFKVVVVTGADLLSKPAQHALRRTMEKYMSTCRLILLCESTSKLIPPLLSRCMLIRNPSPSDSDVVKILQKVGNQEFQLTKYAGAQAVPVELAQRIAATAKGNLRKALLMLDACRSIKGSIMSHGSLPTLDPSMRIPTPDWEIAVLEIADGIRAEQSPKKILEIRKQLYELLVNCIPPDVILIRVADNLFQHCDSSIKPQIAHWAAFYETRCQQGMKPVIHIEAFVTKAMEILKEFSISQAGTLR